MFARRLAPPGKHGRRNQGIGANQNKKIKRGPPRAAITGRRPGRGPAAKTLVAPWAAEPPLTARNGSEPYPGERDLSERKALPTPYSRSDGVRPAALPPRAHAVERREFHRRKPVDDGLKIFMSAPMGKQGGNARRKNLFRKGYFLLALFFFQTFSAPFGFCR